MSRFLRVSVINDRIQDIIEASSMLLESLQQTETCDAKQKEMAADIYSLAVDLKALFPSGNANQSYTRGRAVPTISLACWTGLLPKPRTRSAHMNLLH